MVTGSVVLPIKAFVLNVLSLTAVFGAMVWIFQYGHLGGLGSTATGTMSIRVPVLMLCVAFGLSMDYEVFLLSRHRGADAAVAGADADTRARQLVGAVPKPLARWRR